MTILGIGGLLVGKIVQGESLAFVETNAAASDVVRWGFGFEDNGFFLPLNEGAHGLATVAPRAYLGIDGKVFDVDKVGKLPSRE